MPDQIPLTQPQPLQNPLQTMSGILGLQQQKQALQTGQYTQQSAQAAAGNDQMSLAERKRVSDYLSNPKNAGRSTDDMAPDITAIAPTTGQDVISGLRKNDSTKVQVQEATSKLSQENKNQAGNFIRSLSGGQHTPDQVGAMMDAVESINPQLKDVLDPLRDRVVHMPPPGPARDQGVAAVATMLDGKSGVAGGTQDTGGGVSATKTDSQGNITPGAKLFDKTRAPGAAIVEDAFNNKHLVNTQDNTSAPIGTGKPQPTKPGVAPGFAQPVAGQDEVLKGVQAARSQGDAVPTNTNVNNKILTLLKQTTTGQGTEYGHNLAAAAGLPSGASYQELSAYLDRQAAQSQSAMGLPNTNAGIETAKSLSGNTQYTNKVIKDKTTLNEALNQGTAAYRQALDNTIGTGPKPDLSKYQEFRSKWAQNFDPEIFKYENAIHTGDAQTQKEIEQEQGLKGMREIATKRKVLQSMVHGQQ